MNKLSLTYTDNILALGPGCTAQIVNNGIELRGVALSGLPLTLQLPTQSVEKLIDYIMSQQVA